MRLKILLENLFAFFRSFVSGFGGDEGGGDDHSDKGEGDQKIMHFRVLLVRLLESLSTSG